MKFWYFWIGLPPAAYCFWLQQFDTIFLWVCIDFTVIVIVEFQVGDEKLVNFCLKAQREFWFFVPRKAIETGKILLENQVAVNNCQDGLEEQHYFCSLRSWSDS